MQLFIIENAFLRHKRQIEFFVFYYVKYYYLKYIIFLYVTIKFIYNISYIVEKKKKRKIYTIIYFPRSLYVKRDNLMEYQETSRQKNINNSILDKQLSCSITNILLKQTIGLVYDNLLVSLKKKKKKKQYNDSS